MQPRSGQWRLARAVGTGTCRYPCNQEPKQEGDMEETQTRTPFIAYYDSLMKDRQARARIGLPSARAVMLSLIVLAERDMWTPNGVRHGYDDELIAVFAGLAPSTTRNYLNKLAGWGYVHKNSNGTFLPREVQ